MGSLDSKKFGLGRLWKIALFAILTSCATEVSEINERDTEDWVAVPVPITGAQLTYDSARVRCSFSHLKNTVYQTICDLVEVLAGGQEVKATRYAKGLEVNWAESIIVKGDVNKKSCAASKDKFKYTCQLEVSGGYAEIKFPVNITDNIQSKNKVESAVVMLPYSVEISAGFIPFVPFHIKVDQKSTPNTTAVSHDLSEATANDVLHGRQAIAFQNWDPNLGAIQQICIADNIAYLVGKHGTVNVIYSKNINNLDSEIRFYAGAPHGQKFLGADVDRFRVQFTKIIDIECDENALYVASDGRVMRVPHAGPVEVIATDPASGLARHQENIYFTSSETGKFYSYSNTSKKLESFHVSFENTQFDVTRPEAVTVSETGVISVAFEQRKSISQVGGVVGNTGFQVVSYNIFTLDPETRAISNPQSINVESRNLTSALPTMRLVADAPGHFFYVINSVLGEIGPASKNLILGHPMLTDLAIHASDNFIVGILANPAIGQAVIKTSATQKLTVVNSRAIKVSGGQNGLVSDQKIFAGVAPLSVVDGRGRNFICHGNLYVLNDVGELKEIAKGCSNLMAVDRKTNSVFYYSPYSNSIHKLQLEGTESTSAEYLKLNGIYGSSYMKMVVAPSGELYMLSKDGDFVLKVSTDRSITSISTLVPKGAGNIGGLAMSKSGDLYLGWYRSIYKFNSSNDTFEKLNWDISRMTTGFFGVVSEISMDDDNILHISTLENYSNAGKILRMNVAKGDKFGVVEEFLDLNMHSDCVTGKITSESHAKTVEENIKVSLGTMCGGRADSLSILGCSGNTGRYTMVYTQYLYGFYNIVRTQRSCAVEENKL